MNFKKYKNLEKQLREVEGEQKTKERMQYFYTTTKEMYQQQYYKLSCDLGVCLAEKSKYGKVIAIPVFCFNKKYQTRYIPTVISESEKVGNLYENPELLEQTKADPFEHC